MGISVPFHLFQEVINQFTVVFALESTNQMILVMIDHHETKEVQDIPETTEAQDILDKTEFQEILEIMTVKIQLELVLIVLINVPYHLFQEVINPFTVTHLLSH